MSNLTDFRLVSFVGPRSMSKEAFNDRYGNKNWMVFDSQSINKAFEDAKGEIEKAETDEGKKKIVEDFKAQVKSLQRVAVETGEVTEKGEDVIEYWFVKNVSEKAGEGSKGGIIIGHTTSGKPVYKNSIGINYDDFNKKEHLEAKEIHEKKSKLRDFSPERRARHSREAKFHQIKADNYVGKGEEDTLEKGLADAFRWNNNMKFNKTGKALKAKFKELQTSQTALLETTKKDVDDKLSALIKSGKIPTQSPYISSTYSKAVSQPYKIFTWRQCEFPSETGKNDITYTNGTEKTLSYASTQEEADACREYNKAVDQYYDICVDLITIKAMIDNLEDNQKYELTQEQMIALSMN